MGTSGAYGGSSRQPWQQARREFTDALSRPVGGGEGADADTDDLSVVDRLGGALADALQSDDPTLDEIADDDDRFSVVEVLPTRMGWSHRADAGGGGAGGAARATTASPGRRGSGSSRSVARSAARGGAAIAGGYALRERDAATLAELGLDLEELSQLGPRMQCARILDTVLGEGGHPDEQALREAAAEQLKAIVTAETPPSLPDAIRGFIASFVFKLGLVELRSALSAGDVDVATAARVEHRLHRWIERRVRQVEVPDSGRMTIKAIMGAAARLSRETLRVMSAGLAGGA